MVEMEGIEFCGSRIGPHYKVLGHWSIFTALSEELGRRCLKSGREKKRGPRCEIRGADLMSLDG